MSKETTNPALNRLRRLARERDEALGEVNRVNMEIRAEAMRVYSETSFSYETIGRAIGRSKQAVDKMING